MNKTIVLIAAAIVLSSISCVQAPDDEGLGAEILQPDSHVTPLGMSNQGDSFNGMSAQGMSAQGMSAQSGELKGFGFASFENAAGPVSSVSLIGTVLHGIDATTKAISGAGFIGATLTGVRGDDTLTPVRIDDVQVSSDPDITLYRLAWYNGTAWVNPCGESDGAPVWATPLQGRWKYAAGTPDGGDHIDDPNLFTFSCMTGVLYKCMAMGYKPWRTVQECNGQTCQNLSLRPFHQACTRMMRGDYCGNGNGHTVTGTIINLYDNHNIQIDESTSMTLEAEWTPEGAKCVKHLRWTTGGQEVINAAQADIDLNCGHIDDYSATNICGTSGSTFTTSVGFSTSLSVRALLRNESTAPPAK
jgi:hypothetical protein